MAEEHTVNQGDCIESIAFQHGLFWETVWNHANNAELRRLRKEPNALLPGDRVFVPDRRVKEESGATQQRHRFRRKGVPSMLRMRILVEDKPRANERYVLEIDGELFSGRTDADGRIEHPIPPNARRGKLTIGEGEEQDEYALQLGHIDPITEITGVQARLNNLGFDCGEVDGQLNDQTKAALTQFQSKHELPTTGEPDEATQQRLEEAHGS